MVSRELRLNVDGFEREEYIQIMNEKTNEWDVLPAEYADLFSEGPVESVFNDVKDALGQVKEKAENFDTSMEAQNKREMDAQEEQLRMERETQKAIDKANARGNQIQYPNTRPPGEPLPLKKNLDFMGN
jgi:Zn-dependent M32 family carboxypeptidase